MNVLDRRYSNCSEEELSRLVSAQQNKQWIILLPQRNFHFGQVLCHTATAFLFLLQNGMRSAHRLSRCCHHGQLVQHWIKPEFPMCPSSSPSLGFSRGTLVQGCTPLVRINLMQLLWQAR